LICKDGTLEGSGVDVVRVSVDLLFTPRLDRLLRDSFVFCGDGGVEVLLSDLDVDNADSVRRRPTFANGLVCLDNASSIFSTGEPPPSSVYGGGKTVHLLKSVSTTACECLVMGNKVSFPFEKSSKTSLAMFFFDTSVEL